MGCQPVLDVFQPAKGNLSAERCHSRIPILILYLYHPPFCCRFPGPDSAPVLYKKGLALRPGNHPSNQTFTRGRYLMPSIVRKLLEVFHLPRLRITISRPRPVELDQKYAEGTNRDALQPTGNESNDGKKPPRLSVVSHPYLPFSDK